MDLNILAASQKWYKICTKSNFEVWQKLNFSIGFQIEFNV